MSVQTRAKTAPRTAPQPAAGTPAPALSLLDQVLGDLPGHAGSPEALAAHLEARGCGGPAGALRRRTARLFDLARELYAPTPGRREPARKPFGVYYGTGQLRALGGYDLVVVHPGQYPAEDVRWLAAQGTRVLAYLTLGEDDGPAAPWHLGTLNTTWNTRHVRLDDPRWHRQLQDRVKTFGPTYHGFFLDTLEVVDVRPEARADMVRLLQKLRRWAPGSYLLANRGFSLLPELSRLANGALLESFSSTWTDGYRRLTPQELEYTAAMKARVEQARLDVYGLDYAVTPALSRFARQRAARMGVPHFVTTRELDRI